MLIAATWFRVTAVPPPGGERSEGATDVRRVSDHDHVADRVVRLVPNQRGLRHDRRIRRRRNHHHTCHRERSRNRGTPLA
jgi:hypothetical protein